jgi:hypothetical protein
VHQRITGALVAGTLPLAINQLEIVVSEQPPRSPGRILVDAAGALLRGTAESSSLPDTADRI